MTKSPRNDEIKRLSTTARKAARAGDWGTVGACALKIKNYDKKSPEAWFLFGLVEKAGRRAQSAVKAFQKTIRLDPRRYDAAIELATQYLALMQHGKAVAVLEKYEFRLENSPLYLDMAAKTWSNLGMHAKAWPLYQKACNLQPNLELFQANLAACSVLVGKIDFARSTYLRLLQRNPAHQRNHYELSKLERARDSAHVGQMKDVLSRARLPAEKNIFLYYAIAKELEDIEQWDEAFHFYQLGGDAAASVAREAGYDVSSDIDTIDKIIDVCNSDWLSSGTPQSIGEKSGKRPIFIVGLPRTGTTLTERIIASHSAVESADETYFMQLAIRRSSELKSRDEMNPAIIEDASSKDISLIAKAYLDAVDYRLGDRPFFIDKFPLNFLYLGFIAKAFPDAHIIHLRRNPMDACFAMYKQSFFKFAYSLKDLASYYAAYDRLHRHWVGVLNDRVIEVQYESLVSDPEEQTRALLQRLGLEFEPACLDFHLNQSPSATASTVQVREKAHTRSVNKWKYFEKPLQTLKDQLLEAGISVDSPA